jgi:hypothetical protein
MRRLTALSLAAVSILVPALAGCGEGGAASGATVSIYVAGSQCGEARLALRKKDWKAGDLKIRLACFPPVEKKGGVDLAAAGADARRATEDSTSVAYLEAPGPGARFSQSIVEAADLAWIETGPAAAAMNHIVTALEGDSSSPRKAVLDEVG